MTWCDLNPPEMYQAIERVCRKPRPCCECSAPILAGERYLLCTGKWEGQFDSHSQHLLCAEACMFIRDAFQDGECICFGELKTWCAEHGLQDRTDPIVRRLRVIMAQIKHREVRHR